MVSPSFAERFEALVLSFAAGSIFCGAVRWGEVCRHRDVHILCEMVSEAVALRMLRARLRPAEERHIIVMGDFNEAAHEQERLHPPSGQVRFPLARHDGVGQALEHLAEVVAGGFSRRQMRDGRIELFSRIGSAYCSLASVGLVSLRARKAYTEYA